jgi:predicted O-methyltransferase YrrM
MEGQLNPEERKIITDRVRDSKPEVALEVGTWLGGGSTLHILKTLEENGAGHLWGIEANESIYARMLENIGGAGPRIADRFTPIFGFSDKVLPDFLKSGELAGRPIGFVFLDGGDNPNEQILEFQLLADAIEVGGVLLSHDAKLRKGKWLVPYLRAHDNWECTLHDISTEGLFEARKISEKPTEESRAAARGTLGRLRRQPVEWVGQTLPSPVVNVIMKFLPDKLLKKVTQGR